MKRILADLDETFLRLVQVSHTATEEKALDALYTEVDTLLYKGDFARVDTWCAALDVTKMPVVLALGWLCITAAAKDRLPERAGLFDRIQQRITKDSPERAADLLKGLGQTTARAEPPMPDSEKKDGNALNDAFWDSTPKLAEFRESEDLGFDFILDVEAEMERRGISLAALGVSMGRNKKYVKKLLLQNGRDLRVKDLVRLANAVGGKARVKFEPSSSLVEHGPKHGEKDGTVK